MVYRLKQALTPLEFQLGDNHYSLSQGGLIRSEYSLWSWYLFAWFQPDKF